MLSSVKPEETRAVTKTLKLFWERPQMQYGLQDTHSGMANCDCLLYVQNAFGTTKTQAARPSWGDLLDWIIGLFEAERSTLHPDHIF